MHLQRVLERLGYKPNEVRVYLTALRLGECTCSDIAVQVRLPRTSVQLMIDKLHKEGLMNFYVKRRYKYWIAENPEKFSIELREREAALGTVMPELLALRSGGGGKPMVNIFMGKDEIKLIHEDILATQHNLIAFIPWNEWLTFLGRDCITDFIERRVQLHLKAQILTPKTTASLTLKERGRKELQQVRFLPDNFALTEPIFVYANKVAIICLNKTQPTAVVIDDIGIKTTMTAFFDQSWNSATE